MLKPVTTSDAGSILRGYAQVAVLRDCIQCSTYSYTVKSAKCGDPFNFAAPTHSPKQLVVWTPI